GGCMSDTNPSTGSHDIPDRTGHRETGARDPVPGPPDVMTGPEASQPGAASEQSNSAPDLTPDLPRLRQPRRRRWLAKKSEEPVSPLTADQRLLVLDAWQRSGLPARDFAPLVGMSRHTLYLWKKKFDTEGPAGL